MLTDQCHFFVKCFITVRNLLPMACPKNKTLWTDPLMNRARFIWSEIMAIPKVLISEPSSYWGCLRWGSPKTDLKHFRI